MHASGTIFFCAIHENCCALQGVTTQQQGHLTRRSNVTLKNWRFGKVGTCPPCSFFWFSTLSVVGHLANPPKTPLRMLYREPQVDTVVNIKHSIANCLQSIGIGYKNLKQYEKGEVTTAAFVDGIHTHTCWWCCAGVLPQVDDQFGKPVRLQGVAAGIPSSCSRPAVYRVGLVFFLNVLSTCLWHVRSVQIRHAY